MFTLILIKRGVILFILMCAILQLGGLTVRADLAGAAERMKSRATGQGLAEKCSRAVGFPHNDMETAELLMQVFR